MRVREDLEEVIACIQHGSKIQSSDLSVQGGVVKMEWVCET